MNKKWSVFCYEHIPLEGFYTSRFVKVGRAKDYHFDTENEANTFAETCATKSPGKQFFVMELKSMFQVPNGEVKKVIAQ